MIKAKLSLKKFMLTQRLSLNLFVKLVLAKVKVALVLMKLLMVTFPPDKLTIHYYTVDGEEKTIRLKDYPAIVSSHEIDHLNGHLFYDRINKQDPFARKEDTVVIS